jgi:hypothetical protein
MRAFLGRHRDYYEAIKPFWVEYEAELARIEATAVEAERAAYRKYTEDCQPAWDALWAYPDDEQAN